MTTPDTLRKNPIRKAVQTVLASGMILAGGGFIPAPAAQAQYDYPSKVPLAFDHFYSYPEMSKALHALADAYPDLLTIQSVGKSVQGRDMWCLTLNNPKTGSEQSKAAMFIDGNIHGNELQAAETVLYSIWYLTKSYGKIDSLTKLVDERCFYFIPIENPDGRQYWFDNAATPDFQRGGMKPVDNDYDGLYDEDGYDDLDGDGSITSMFRKDPLGRFKPDPTDPRTMIRVGEDEAPGGWTYAGSEGIDNDGDGEINEDGPGGYDPNRDWPADWQPGYIQYGACDYPFSLPESRAIADFMLAHPNIAAFQSFHNDGGMILRGPGAEYINYPQQDIRAYDQIQDTGALMLPYYRKMTLWSDLYTVHGGEVDWAYEGLGIFALTNELWNDKKMFQDGKDPDRDQMKQFRELLQFDEPLVPYHLYHHPQLGDVLIGGEKKWSRRVPPPWLEEEDCHRNFAFTMFNAREMPRVQWGIHQIRPMTQTPNPDLWEVTVEVRNDRILPTISAMARMKQIGRRDYMSCMPASGSSNKVVASGSVWSFLNDAKLLAQEHHPEKIWNDGGISGHGREIYRFLVEGAGKITLEYYSEKGGDINVSLDLKEDLPELPPSTNVDDLHQRQQDVIERKWGAGGQIPASSASSQSSTSATQLDAEDIELGRDLLEGGH